MDRMFRRFTTAVRIALMTLGLTMAIPAVEGTAEARPRTHHHAKRHHKSRHHRATARRVKHGKRRHGHPHASLGAKRGHSKAGRASHARHHRRHH
jgi:hypothetical protein